MTRRARVATGVVSVLIGSLVGLVAASQVAGWAAVAVYFASGMVAALAVYAAVARFSARRSATAADGRTST